VLENIRETATAYFAGLSKENVSVIDIGASHTSQANSLSNSIGHPVLSLKAKWEEYYHQKVSELLNDYENVKIGVTVTFDPQTTKLVQGEAQQIDSPQTEIRSTTWRRLEVRSPEDSDLSNEVSEVRETQSSLNRPQSIVTRTEETEETKLVRSESVTVDDRIKRILPSSVSINVGIPESHYLRIHEWRWHLANRDRPEKLAWTPPDEHEMELIRQQANEEVRAAISNIPDTPTSANSAQQPAINVYAYTDVPIGQGTPLDWMQRAEIWISDSWKSVVLLSLTIICLGVMFAWMRSPTPSSDTVLDTVSEMDASAEALYEPMQSDQDSPKGQGCSSTSEPEQVKEDLSSLVRENPEAAKKLLKSWLGDAA
jgi:flagellar biosynthesis/type III secretory pathway M-ring protein FliF/YscJ